MSDQISLAWKPKQPIRWDAIDDYADQLGGYSTAVYAEVEKAFAEGKIQGRLPDYSTFYRHRKPRWGGPPAPDSASRHWKVLEPGSPLATAVERVKTASRAGLEAIQALHRISEISDDEITRHQRVNKHASDGWLRRQVEKGNLAGIEALARDLETRATLFARRLGRAETSRAPAKQLPAPEARSLPSGPVKPAGTEGVDPLYGTEGPTKWGEAADAAAQPLIGQQIGYIRQSPTEANACARFALVAPLLNNPGLGAAALSAHWRNTFEKILGIPGAELPGIPREFCEKYRRIEASTLLRWRKAIQSARDQARRLGLQAETAVVTLRHQYPDHRRAPRKCTAAVVRKIEELYADHPEWSAASIAYHLRKYCDIDISDRRVQQVVKQIRPVEQVEARGGPAGVETILQTRLLREVPYANRVWIIDNTFIKFETPGGDSAPGDNEDERLDFDFCVERTYPGGLVERKRVTQLYLTTIIDSCTRKHLLVRVWDEPPSTRTAVLALMEAMQLWGVPEVVYSDNGSDFRSRGVYELLLGAGVQQVFSVPYSPRSRGRIERPYRTIKERVLPLLAGYAGGEYRQQWHEADLLTLPVLQHWIRLGVEEHINKAVCRTTKQIPDEHYERSIGARGFARPPIERLIPMLLRDDDVRLDGPGFTLGGHYYHCDAFSGLANGSTISVYHDPGRQQIAYVALPEQNGSLTYKAVAEIYGPGNPPPTIGQQRQREAAYRRQAETMTAQKRQEALERELLIDATTQGRLTGLQAAEAVLREHELLTAPAPLRALPAGPVPAAAPVQPIPAEALDQPADPDLRPVISLQGKGGSDMLTLPWE